MLCIVVTECLPHIHGPCRVAELLVCPYTLLSYVHSLGTLYAPTHQHKTVCDTTVLQALITVSDAYDELPKCKALHINASILSKRSY
jgi:hypothetical protein